MIKLIQISETFGDCTAKYAVEMTHSQTNLIANITKIN